MPIKSDIKSKREKSLLNAAKIKMTNTIINAVPILSLFRDSAAVLYSTTKQLYCDDFLVGIGKQLEESKNVDKAIRKLSKKINDKTFSETITTILDSLLFSKSYKSRVILGIIAAKYLSSDKVDYEDMILISALKDLYDIELHEFVEFTHINDYSVEDKTKFLYDFTNTQRIVMEKLKNLSVLGNDLALNRYGGEKDSLSFQMTTVSDRLLEYLQKIKD